MNAAVEELKEEEEERRKRCADSNRADRAPVGQGPDHWGRDKDQYAGRKSFSKERREGRRRKGPRAEGTGEEMGPAKWAGDAQRKKEEERGEGKEGKKERERDKRRKEKRAAGSSRGART